MSNKKLTVLVLILALLVSTVAESLIVNFGVADPYEAYTYTAPPIISIHSPVDNETFCSNNVPLNFTITKPEGWLISWSTVGNPKVFKNKLSQVNITLDEKDYRSIDVNSYLSSPFSYSEDLTNLADGVHNLAIHTYCDGWDLEGHGFWERYLPYETSSDLINFTIDTTPPRISIENITYETPSIPLNFTISGPVSQIIYSLDGEGNVTVSRNITLSGLSNGAHNVTVYAIDEAGNIGASEIIYFSVDVHFPTTFIAAISASIAIVGVGLLVYFKKRKGSRNP
jgi:hypothetical protein